MLGSEYNWLLSHSRTSAEIPRVRLASTGMLTLAVAVFCFLAVALRAEPAHVGLMREAAAAREAGNTEMLIAKLEAARALRPDYPRVLTNLARAYTAAGRMDDALAVLRDVAAMGIYQNIDADQAFAPLQARAEFIALAKTFAANKATVTAPASGEKITVLPAMNGIVESVATHPATGELFFGDVHNRCIWSRPASADPSAPLARFSTDSDALVGVFAVKIDATAHALWAICSALPEMKGYTAADKGRAFLVRYDLAKRTLAQRYAIPTTHDEHVLGDFALAADGAIYVTDSTAPLLWRLAPGGTQLEKWLEHSDFVSLQGIALSRDSRTLHVADYANGLWRIDVVTRAVTLLRAPAHTTFFGIDGLCTAPDDALIAVQNGIVPQRVLRVILDPSGEPARAEVLRAGQADMTDITLGEVTGGRFQFIANGGWNLFGDAPSAPTARTVTVLSTPLL